MALSLVVDAIDPTKGGGAHLPNSGHDQIGHNQHDTNTYSLNPLSSNTHSTGPHASTGAGLTGSSHATYGHRAEDGRVVDAVNPMKGSGPHIPSSGQHDSSLTGNHHGTGLSESNAPRGRLDGFPEWLITLTLSLPAGTHQNDPVHNSASSLHVSSPPSSPR